MVAFRPSSPAADDARELLTEYFAIRAKTFPSDQGVYRTTFPEPAAFEPPAGVFVLLDAGPDELPGGRSDDSHTAATRAVGCGGIRRLDSAGAGPLRYEVKHLYLRPETRGHGWGRELLDELERHARSFGATELVLDTHHTLEAAGGLYASSGFTPIAPYNHNPNATRWYGKPLGSSARA